LVKHKERTASKVPRNESFTSQKRRRKRMMQGEQNYSLLESAGSKALHASLTRQIRNGLPTVPHLACL